MMLRNPECKLPPQTRYLVPLDHRRHPKPPVATVLADLIPVSDKTFWKILKSQEETDEKFKWSSYYKPWPCEIHDNGPGQEYDLEHLIKKFDEEGGKLEDA